VVAAKSVRATDIGHRWEWTAVQAPDVAEAITLRTPQIEKLYAPSLPRLLSQQSWWLTPLEWMWSAHTTAQTSTKPTNSLCPPNKRGNVVTAAKDSVAVNKGECWSVRLANVNRVYLRASAHGKYLRSRNPTEAICTFLLLSFLLFCY
jgi:hypothetical protein